MRSPSRYFNNTNFTPTQKLAEDLVIENIRIHGVPVLYMPKELVNLDEIFGEDGLVKFENAVQIEAFVKNADSFGGQGKILSKLGIQINEEIILVVSSKRFEEVRAETVLTETNQSFEQEVTYRYAPGQVNGFLLEDASKEGYYIQHSRPQEGDLIYVPTFQKVFEIKYCDNDSVFFQFGQNYIFELTCEVYEYSNERFNTGYSEVDDIENTYTTDSTNSSLITEASENLVMENGDLVITEEYDIHIADPTANNATFTNVSDEYVDFSEKNPFVKGNLNLKW